MAFIDLYNTSPAVRAWVRQVFEDVEGFPQPSRFVDSKMVAAIQQWKSIESRRRAFERVWQPRFEVLLASAGSTIAAEYASSQNVDHVVQVATRVLRPGMEKLMERLHQEVDKEFVRAAILALKPRKSTVGPEYLKEQEPIDPDALDWEEQDPYDLPKLQQYNRLVTAQKVRQITETTMNGIRRVVQRALDEGLSVDDTARALRRAYGFSKDRAVLIAQTEVVSASNAASHFSLEHNLPTSLVTKSWLNAGDKRVRPTHVQAGASQKNIPFKEPFVVGGSRLMFPGDASLGALGKEVISCRCTAIYDMPRPTFGNKPPRAATTPTPPPAPPAPKPKPKPKPKPGLNPADSYVAPDLWQAKERTRMLSEPWWEKLTDLEKKSIDAYTGTAYEQINTVLRGQAPSTPEVKDHIARLRAANEKATPLDQQLKVFRGLPAPVNLLPELAHLEIGGTYHPAAFSSTTLGPNRSFKGPTKMEIHLPIGSKVTSVNGYGAHGAEAEILLPPNAKLRLIGRRTEAPSSGNIPTTILEFAYEGTTP